MGDWMTLLIATALLQNMALNLGLGLSPALDATSNGDRALWASLLGAPVLVLASALGWLLESLVLRPQGWDALRLPVLLGITALIAQSAVLGLRAGPHALRAALNPHLALFGVHWTILGLGLVLMPAPASLGAALAIGLGTALGVGVVLVPLAALVARLGFADVPAPFRGLPIALVSLALAALAFLGFNGLVKV